MNEVAQALLNSRAVHIRPSPEDFFTWTSGKRSPIYCDNRTLISYPIYRKKIVQKFIELIKSEYSEVELIAGTATAGIPWASWIADKLDLPMVYIRSKAKGHGLKSAIEGKIEKHQKTLIIEDLISTGKSSIEAYQHAKQDELNVLGVLSIFTYGFSASKERFQEENLKYTSLCTLDDILGYAKDESLLNQADVESVLSWSKSFI